MMRVRFTGEIRRVIVDKWRYPGEVFDMTESMFTIMSQKFPLEDAEVPGDLLEEAGDQMDTILWDAEEDATLSSWYSEENEPVEEYDATDSARSYALEHGINLESIVGTGLGGRITLADVKLASEEG